MAAVRFFAPDTDAFVEFVASRSEEFREKTGLDLDINIIASDEYFSNEIQRYLQGDSAADVFMSGPVLLWEHIGKGFVEPLQEYVSRAGSGYDCDNTWTGQFGDKLGSGMLWEIPVNCETYNLAVNAGIAERFELPVPRTWAEYFAAAEDARSRAGINGFAQRGIQVWHTMYTGFATQFWSYGARDFDDHGRCAIASPEGLQATTDFLTALKQSGPPDWENQRWYELAMDFAAGKYAYIVDSDHYVAFFEAQESALKGSITYAHPPAGPTGNRTPNMWTWSLVMNARSRSKEAAWRFIEWASGKEFLLESAFAGNMNPTRRSVWDHERFQELASGWGTFAEVSRDLIEHHSRVLVTPFAGYRTVADRWVRGLMEAYGGVPVEDALLNAAADIDQVVSQQSDRQ
jgi:multiple sugar transport system substrate-binding protein